MGSKYKEVEILTDDFKNSFNKTDKTNTLSISKKTGICGFDPEMWKKQYPGLETDYFSNIQEYCEEKSIDENKVNKEVLNLAIEVAQQIHSTGVDNWIQKNGITKRDTLYKIL